MDPMIRFWRRSGAALSLALLLGAAPPGALAAGEVEPNDTLDQAQALVGSRLLLVDGSRTFDNASDDFYAFVVPQVGLLRIIATSANSSADTVMGLFGSTGQLLASNDDGEALESMSAIDFLITQPGTYRLGLSGFDAGLIACSDTVKACYDTDGDFVFDTYVAGGSGGSTGFDYQLSITGVAMVPEPAAALLLLPGLALLSLRRRLLRTDSE